MAEIRTGYSAGAAASGPIAGVEVVSARRRISWGAIFAGVTVVLAVQLLLSMLGLGVSLSFVNPAEGNSPNTSSIGLGAGTWWGVSYLIALFAGGYVAGRLAGWSRFICWAPRSAASLAAPFSVVGNTVSTATGASRASFVAFVGLVLGAVAAALGGQVGARSRVKEIAPADSNAAASASHGISGVRCCTSKAWRSTRISATRRRWQMCQSAS
jgi:hypothetical protein